MYIADYHTHSRLSPDGTASFAEMVEGARRGGVDELCLTDHCDMTYWVCPDGNDWTAFSWDEEERELLSVKNPGIRVRLGIEIGEPLEKKERSEMLLADRRKDFVIASLHNTPGRDDFAIVDWKSRAQCLEWLSTLYDEYLRVAKWGRFSVLGHLTYPLRYMTERDGIEVDCSDFLEVIDEIYKVLVQSGKGIELNCNRGNGLLPYPALIKRYREAGGEIITLGSDAHYPRHIGAGIAAGQQILRECGFEYFTVFNKMKPEFIKL